MICFDDQKIGAKKLTCPGNGAGNNGLGPVNGADIIISKYNNNQITAFKC